MKRLLLEMMAAVIVVGGLSTQSAMASSSAPFFSNVSLSPTSVSVGSGVSVTFTVTSSSGWANPNVIAILSGPGGVNFSRIISPDASGNGSGSILIPLTAPSGTYSLNFAGPIDGNGLSPAFSTYPTVTVTGSTSSSTPPYFSNVAVSPQRLLPGDSVSVSFKVTSSSGYANPNVIALLSGPGGVNFSRIISPDGTGNGSGSIPIPLTAPPGTYTLNFAGPIDGNGLSPAFSTFPTVVVLSTTQPTPTPTPTPTTQAEKEMAYNSCQSRNTIALSSATISNPSPKLEDCGQNPALAGSASTSLGLSSIVQQSNKVIFHLPLDFANCTLYNAKILLGQVAGTQIDCGLDPSLQVVPSPSPSLDIDTVLSYSDSMRKLNDLQLEINTLFVSNQAFFLDNPTLKTSLSRALTYKAVSNPSKADVSFLNLLIGNGPGDGGLLDNLQEAKLGISKYLPVRSKSSSTKQTLITITCVKGASVKKVIALKPICPAGYKKK